RGVSCQANRGPKTTQYSLCYKTACAIDVGQIANLMPLVFPLLAMLRKLWGRPPGLRGTPPSRLWDNGASVLQGASRPTGASAAVQGDRPTIYAGAQHRKNERHWLWKLRATQRGRAPTGATGGVGNRRTH